MKRIRRTKQEIEWMVNDCRLYLLSNGLDAHKAFEAMVKDHLMSGIAIPHYIKGIKDFIMAADQLKIQLNRTKKEEQKKEDPISLLQSLTVEKFNNEIRPLMKQQEDKTVKMSIVNLWAYIESGTFKGITEQEIRHYKELNII